MSVKFTKSATFVKSDDLKMKWQTERFITQGGFFLHAAVIEYQHPETGNIIGVAFANGGDVVVFQDPVKGVKDGRQVTTIANKIAKENFPIVKEGGFPESFLTDYEEAFALYEDGEMSDAFDPDAWSKYFTPEDIEDIEARIQDLSVYWEEEEIDF